MAEFPAHLFRMDGDPSAIRSSASRWQSFGTAATDAGAQITGLDTGQFVGPEGDQFRDGLHADMPRHLRITGDAFDRVAAGLTGFADRLGTLQDQMRPLAQRAPGLWAAVQSARGRVDRAAQADARHEREVADRSPEETAPDSYRSDSGAAGAAFSAAQRDWDDCVGQATALRGELTTAVRECVAVVNEAKGMRFTENPKWWDLGGQFTNFVRDNRELLQQLSGALKIVSLVAGLLAFIPVLAPVMAPLAIAAGAAALLIDTSVYAATGQGSLTSILIDGVLTVVPFGRLARVGGGLLRGTRVAQAFSSVANRGRNMLSVARWGLANPRGNGIEALGRLVRLDPIDIAGGEMVLSQTDVELPGSLPLVLGRTHLSSYRMGSWFGRSWASTLDQRVEVDDTGLYLATDDGMTLIYPADGAGRPARLPLEGPRWTLEPGPGPGSWAVTDPRRGWTRHFGPVPGGPLAGGPLTQLPLVAVTDRNGHRIEILHDETGAPAELVHSGGYRVLVTTEENRIVALALAAGTEGGPDTVLLRFGYNEFGDLTEVTDSSGLPLRFDYDLAGRITRWADRNGTEYRYGYDEEGRCVATTGTGGCLTGRLHHDPAARTTTVVDSLGNETVYQLNELRQAERITDPLGNVTTCTWDRYDRKLSETDPLGRTTRYGYDDDGNLVEVVRPDGARATARYNHLHQPLTVTDHDGAVWRRAYDARGNLTMLADPAGATTWYRYDRSGHLTEVVDPLGNTLRIGTDRAGLINQVVDATGAVTRYRRDPAGRVVEVTDPLGGTTRLGWTVEGRLAWRRRPDGAGEEWRYDPEGNLVAHIDPSGATTLVEFGPFDLPAARTGPDGSRLTFGYDTELRLRTVSNPQGLTWHYDYDRAGRLVAETDFNGRRQTYTHDAAGQLVARDNGAGQRVELDRDAAGNVLRKRTAEGVTTFEYDPMGRLRRAASPGAELRLERDRLGRVVAEILDGRAVTSGYDQLGRRVRRRTPAGVGSVWEYDGGHRPVALHTAGRTVRFDHDAAGREIRRTVGDLVLAQTWDPNHRLLAQILTATPGTAPGGGPPRMVTHRAYRYRIDGYLLEIADQLTGGRQLELDRVGRITAVRAAGWTERYAYDGNGSITAATWSGAGEGEGLGEERGEREYTGTLLRRAGNVRYEYDAAGRMVLRQRRRHSTGPATWRYEWDSEDRLVAVTTADGTRWRYRYDALGRRAGKERLDAAGTVVERVEYAWDGPLLVEQSHHRQTSTWEYAPGTFTPIAQTDAGMVGRPEAPVDQAEVDQAEVDRRFYAIVADLTGTPTELVTPDGRVVWQRRTTVWGIPTHAGDSGVDCPLRFPGQIHDPETGASYNYQRYYDPATARYQSTDPLGLDPGPDPHAYVPNPTREIDPLGLTPYPAPGRSGALNQAKRDLGIPRAQHPDRVDRVPLTDRDGRRILGENNQPVMTREYTYTRPDGSQVVIQDHAAGHRFGEGGVGDQGPHFNVRPPENTRTGHVPGTLEHYPF
ncbi:HNH/endonuclease VII fold putative polymorphic toxin [Plantactinospora sp. WMMC1484]|uniref:HNH/endonuclease VII fold putative polymorphic toxin n=1 Tax=Plantactinospora sp. WMMC1484 TaxID=3404122 RepID=UPI003BF5097C